MLRQYATKNPSSSDNRMFVYEVKGLHENEVTTNHQSPIRDSHTQLIQVPFSRMNEVMRWVNCVGGEIVAIRPL